MMNTETMNIIRLEELKLETPTNTNLKVRPKDNKTVCTRKPNTYSVEIREGNSLLSYIIFDETSRVIYEDNFPLNTTTVYKYDNHGNIKQRIEYPFSTCTTNELNSGKSFTYQYTEINGKDYLTKYNDETFEYDSLGNPVIYRNHPFTWSNHNLISINGIVDFSYNNVGLRVSKLYNNHKTRFAYKDNKLIKQSGGCTLTFDYNADELVGFHHETKTKSNKYTFLKNHRGDVTGIYNENNQLIVKYYYDTLGNSMCKVLTLNNEYVSLDTLSNMSHIDKTTLNHVHIAKINPIRFHSLYFDSETGIYYDNGRYYDPEIGRYL